MRRVAQALVIWASIAPLLGGCIAGAPYLVRRVYGWGMDEKFSAEKIGTMPVHVVRRSNAGDCEPSAEIRVRGSISDEEVLEIAEHVYRFAPA